MLRGKIFLKWMGKAVCAGGVAFLLLNLFCLVYSNQGVHITNPTGATDYVWQPNSFFSKMTEGITYGYLDQGGFNNSYPAEQDVDILLMGSSHMEAFQMRQDQNIGYQLNRLLHQAGNSGDYVYNIGMSGHGFTDCISNLPYALEYYRPKKAVIIEMMTLGISEHQVSAVLEGTRTRAESYDSGLIYMLQQIPFLKLVYSQLKGFNGTQEGDIDLGAEVNMEEVDASVYTDAISSLLRKAADCMDDINLIIFYHPTLYLDGVGNVYAKTDQDKLEIVSSVCKANGITFLDMTEPFIEAYETNHILPHGFANTGVGVGHLNRHGHRMIAEELAKILETLEVNA